jgi:hypothetical protein
MLHTYQVSRCTEHMFYTFCKAKPWVHTMCLPLQAVQPFGSWTKKYMELWWLQIHWDTPLLDIPPEDYPKRLRPLLDSSNREGAVQSGVWAPELHTLGQLGLRILQKMQEGLQIQPPPEDRLFPQILGHGWRAFHRPRHFTMMLNNHNPPLRREFWLCALQVQQGYSRIRMGRLAGNQGGKSRSVYEYSHRLLVWLMLGPPNQLHVGLDRAGQLPWIAMHSCDRPNCLQPDHVFWGTSAMNNWRRLSRLSSDAELRAKGFREARNRRRERHADV